MTERRLAIFRADASAEIGSGHVMRCLTLASGLAARGYECLFICRDLPGHMGETIVAGGHRVHLLPKPAQPAPAPLPDDPAHAGWLGVGWQDDAEETRHVISGLGADWLIADHYAIDRRWENRIAPLVRRLMAIDDLADRPHAVDLLLDQTIGRTAELYSGLVAPGSNVLAGARYALLRDQFAEHRAQSLARREQAALKRLIIFLGSHDGSGATGRVLSVLAKMDALPVTEIDVVLGGMSPHRAEVEAIATSLAVPTRVHVDVTDMAALLASADLAIGAAGTSSLERCALGLPALTFVLADNQTDLARELEATGAALVVGRLDTGWEEHLKTALRTASAPAMLKRLSQAAQAQTDGRGCARVIDAMMEKSLSVRRAAPQDTEAVWRWRHADNAVQFYQNPAEIPLDDHKAWFAAALTSPDRLMFTVLDGETPIAFVRYDLVPEDRTRAVVSIVMAPESKSKGLSRPALRRTLAAAAEHGVVRIDAYIHRDNLPSLRLFERGGFVRAEGDDVFILYRLSPEL